MKIFKSLTLFLFLIALLAPSTTDAHAPDQSYIYLRIYQNSMGGRFELTTEYLNKALGLGLSKEASLEQIRPQLPQIYAYLKQQTGFGADGKSYSIEFTEPTILALEETDDYVLFNFDMQDVTEVPKILDVRYNILMDIDPKHRGLLIVEYNWKAGIHDNEAMFANIFEPGKTEQQLSLEDASVWKGFVALVKLGVWHIWIGLDHILFIIALILPAVVRRNKDKPYGVLGIGQWEPVKEFKPAFLYLIKIVTFFTIAHSITLALASLQIINPPSYLVEAIIAFSIGLAAFHNIYPIFNHKEWMVAFVFGLFHGFGFASVLGEKGLGGDFLVYSLLGFNLGVEIGQLLIICLAFPVLFLLRKTAFYRYFIVIGSALLIFIALHWTIERGFDIDIRLVSTVRNFLGI